MLQERLPMMFMVTAMNTAASYCITIMASISIVTVMFVTLGIIVIITCSATTITTTTINIIACATTTTTTSTTTGSYFRYSVTSTMILIPLVLTNSCHYLPIVISLTAIIVRIKITISNSIITSSIGITVIVFPIMI